MEQIDLAADRRAEKGSPAARRHRRQGLVPATVYGRGLDPQSVTVNARELSNALRTEAGLNAIISLAVNGETVTTLAREIQRHPVRGDIIHVDFVQISLTDTVQAEVGLELVGTPLGVRESGAIVETIRNVVLIEALPAAIPSSIVIDINDLDVGDVVRVADLPAMEGVTYLDDEDTGLISIMVPRVVEEAEPEVEGEELEEGEEVPEGEEGAEEAAEEAGAEESGEE